MKLARKKYSQKAKAKSLALGSEKSHKARREAGMNSFTDEHRKALRLKKLIQYHNYLAIYLIEKGIDTRELMQFTKRLNTPNYHNNESKFLQSIERFVEEVNRECAGGITNTTALELITKCLKIKETMFPLQTVSIT